MGLYSFVRYSAIHLKIFSYSAEKIVIFEIMEEHLSFGTKILNGFLRVMVVVLVLILAAVVLSLLLAAVGLL